MKNPQCLIAIDIYDWKLALAKSQKVAGGKKFEVCILFSHRQRESCS